MAEAKESQWFWAIPNASRFCKVRLKKYEAEDFLEGEFFGGEVENEDITLAPALPCACYEICFCRLGRSANSHIDILNPNLLKNAGRRSMETFVPPETCR